MSVLVDMSTGADWREQSLCASIGSHLFDSYDGESPAARVSRIAAAKKVCKSCDVPYECLAAALEEEDGTPCHERQGVRGGFGARVRYEQGPLLLRRVAALP
jgi:hypothetical protein